MIVYADTGFLISLYGRDANSPAAVAVTQGKPVFILTPLAQVRHGGGGFDDFRVQVMGQGFCFQSRPF